MATNYEKLFGNPGRAAETLEAVADRCANPEFGVDACDGCPLDGGPCPCSSSLLKWLESEAGE